MSSALCGCTINEDSFGDQEVSYENWGIQVAQFLGRLPTLSVHRVSFCPSSTAFLPSGYYSSPTHHTAFLVSLSWFSGRVSWESEVRFPLLFRDEVPQSILVAL